MPRSSARRSPITTTWATFSGTPEASSLALISGPMPVTSPSIRPMTGLSMCRGSRSADCQQLGQVADALQLLEVEYHVYDPVGFCPRELTPGGALAEFSRQLVVAHRVGRAALAEIRPPADLAAVGELDVDNRGH